MRTSKEAHPFRTLSFYKWVVDKKSHKDEHKRGFEKTMIYKKERAPEFLEEIRKMPTLN